MAIHIISYVHFYLINRLVDHYNDFEHLNQIRKNLDDYSLQVRINEKIIIFL